MISGAYMIHADLIALAAKYRVPVVDTFGQVTDVDVFVATGRALAGVEGYVVAFEGGHRLKLKADGYVLRHKALAGVAYEKNLLAWIVEDALDDVIPILHDDVAERVRVYQTRLMASVDTHLSELTSFASALEGADRRTYAIETQARIDKRLHPVAFAIADGNDPRAAIMKLLKRATGSENRVDQIRDLFDLEWKGSDLVMRDI